MTRQSRIVAGLALVVGVLMLLVNERLFHTLVSEAIPATLLCVLAGAILCATALFKRTLSVAEKLFQMPSKTFLSMLFALSFIFHIAIAIDTFDAVPRLDDGVAAVFQARIFATGRVVIPQPPLPEYFGVFGVISSRAGVDHWCGMYPPGWPALLVPGVLIHAPWLVNPFLGALLVVCIVLLAREFGSEQVARTAGLIALCSPLATTLAATHLSHTGTALFSTFAFLCARKLMRTKKTRFGLLAGTSIAIAFLCRPLTGAVVGLAIGLGLLFEVKELARAWKGAVLAILAVILGFGMLLAFQKQVTGDPFTAGHEIGFSRAKFGFGEIDDRRTHTPAIGLKNTVWRFRVMNDSLAGWPIPACFFALVPFVCGRWRRTDIALALPFGGLLFAYLFYWYYESYFPARYTFSGWPMMMVLVSRGLCELGTIASRRQQAVWRAFSGAVLASILFLFVVVSPPTFRRFHSAFGDVEGILPKVVETYGITNAVVFMDSIGVSSWVEDRHNNYYATGFMRNDLELKNDVIYANNSREHNAILAKQYPGRNYYLYRFDRSRNKAQLFHMLLEGGGVAFKRIPSKRGKLLTHWVPEEIDVTPKY